MAKVKLGTGECDRCGEQVVWRCADSGSLSYTCQYCDFRGYAPAHTDAAKMIAGEITKNPAAAITKPLPVEAPPAPVKPVPKPKASGWDALLGVKA